MTCGLKPSQELLYSVPGAKCRWPDIYLLRSTMIDSKQHEKAMTTTFSWILTNLLCGYQAADVFKPHHPLVKVRFK